MKIILEQKNLTISTTLKGSFPFLRKLPFFAMKNEALSADYELSVVFIANKRCRTLNRTHRDIDKPTDILSFPFDQHSGEIFINIPYSRKKAAEFNRTFENYIPFIFIHGLIHLKGHNHGSIMESKELIVRKKFGI